MQLGMHQALAKEYEDYRDGATRDILKLHKSNKVGSCNLWHRLANDAQWCLPMM